METMAKAGEKVPFVWSGTGQKEMVEVRPPCTNKTGGKWYCTTHNVGWQGSFDENADHLDKSGRHHLVWCCFEHGLEQAQ